MSGAILGSTTFAALGLLFLITAVRAFTSSLYMSQFGKIANETVGVIALAVFAASAFAVVLGVRFAPRSAVALSGTILVGGTILATVARADWADILLSAVALVGGTWWLATTHSARSRLGTSPFVLGLPFAIAADLALRSALRTIAIIDLAVPLAVALTVAGGLLFLAAGAASLDPEREWTSPGLRGSIALGAIPPLLLVGELGGWNPAQAAGAAALARGPEQSGSWYLVATVLGLGMTLGAVALSRARPPQRSLALGGVAIGTVLLALHIPVLSTLGAAILAFALIVASAILADTPARAVRTPATTAIALAVGWLGFVALAFLFYAYYALAVAFWIAAGLVIVGLVAATPLAGPRLGAGGTLVVGALVVLVPVVALVTTPAAPTQARPTFRLMTYNIHQGFDDGNVASLDRIADTIDGETPDVVVLQEVVRGWMITQQHDALTYLSERLQMPYVFGPAIGDLYGNAVLSRLPISDVRYISYERQPQIRHQPRGAILFRVAEVLVIATHLDHIAGATDVRQGQVRAILEAWAGVRPAVVAGDLNALPGTPELRMLEAAGFVDLAAKDGADQPTSPGSEPKNRVDYVWGIGVTGTQAHTVPSIASDHRPVVVNIARGP